MTAALARLTAVSGDFVALLWFDTLIKATVLLTVTSVATALLRRRSAAVRHRVWSVTLIGLLFLPMLALLLPGWRMSVLPDLPTLVVAPAPVGGVSAAKRAIPEGSDVFSEQVSQAMPLQQRAPVAAAPPADATGSPTVIGPNAILERTATSLPAITWPVLLSIIWLLGAAFCSVRVAASVFRSAALGARSRRITDPASTQLLFDLAQRLGVKLNIRLMETDRPLVPMTWGLWRPTILLPMSWRQWSAERIRIALLHEVAHVKRRDVLIQLLARLACALYWFHPLAWYALRKLRIERELACDDCVLTAGERATDYARELLDIARSLRLWAAPAAVAMAHTPHLEWRVRALLDGARSHLPLGRTAGWAILLVAAIVVTGIAVVQPAATLDAKELTSEASKDKPTAATASLIDAKADQITGSGVVRSPAGKPLAGATVRAVVLQWAMLKSVTDVNQPPLAEVRTDNVGHFTISFTAQPFGDLSHLDPRWKEIWKETLIVASHRGYGPAWLAYKDIKPGEKASLQLVPDVPIRGRMIDQEGNPVAGLAIQIDHISATKDENLTPWLDAIKAGEFPWTAVWLAPKQIHPASADIPQQVVTDQQGRFEILGVGRERCMSLAFHSETVAHQEITVVTRPMQPIARVLTPRHEGKEPVLGAEFTFTTAPSRPIVGTVLDAKTGQPLPGVSVESYKLVGYPFVNHRVLKTSTDNQGRFRLIGMPKGEGNELLIVPNDDQPYLMREVNVPPAPEHGPAAVDIELHRGIWIVGRVTDKTTGEPAYARLHYLPFRTNEFAKAMPEFGENFTADGDQNRYQTRPDGSYRLVGLPGLAIIGAESVLRQYRMGVGCDEIDGPKDDGHFDTYSNPVHPSGKWPNVVKAINPPAGAESVTVDFEMESGQSIRIRMIDPDGRPIGGVTVNGRFARSTSETIDEALFEAVNFSPDETRAMLFHHKERNLGCVARISVDQGAAEPITIRLQPTATVKGRLLVPDGSSLSGAAVDALVLPAEDFGQDLPTITANADGRFEYTLLPGANYRLRIEAVGLKKTGFGFVEVSVAPGESKDLGDITISGR